MGVIAARIPNSSGVRNARSQSCTAGSDPPVASVFPSGLMATEWRFF